MKRKWDVSSKEQRQKCIDEVIARLNEQEGDFGVFAAEDVIDIVTQNLGPDIYNKGVKDSKKLIQDRFADLDVEIDLLKSE